ncbi:uncharacterized protein LOC132180422 [Corylus avellana]|uniref:uncharacterized protein LOC132180422 n=1 Tax=Corylus avellana TaxID=13451 RepID=UPI00286C6442|nr:uncharacterized protein LOC132180422 [Corylus avellana]
MKAISAPRGGAILCSHTHHFTLCNRLCFLSLHPSCPPRPHGLHLTRSSRFLTHSTPLSPKPHRFILQAAESTQPTSLSSSTDKTVIADAEFSLAKVSFGVIGLGLGVTLLSYGFGAYFNILPGSEWSAIMLTYGFPLAIIGMALKYAELKPVPCLTYSDAQNLREACATPILKQVRNDVIRYRYGDEQHLDEALKRIFQYGQGGGIPRRSAPILQMIREEVTEDGKYCLVLVFEAKALQLSDFEKRQAKFASFFGPGITAEVGKSGNDDLYEVRLISNSNSSPNPNASP